ncbi:acyl-CoA dehydrogenase [Streptomyces griseofuscus]|uniref:acyl-CoA dehydrogenase n=1 Tax=Streptomyces griseofuscus TaxID=146922 RepID=UPI0036B2C760
MALNDLCALFLLHQVNSRCGLLLAEGALTCDQVLALPHTQQVLTARLAPHLLALTEAFLIPEEHLSSLPMLTPEGCAEIGRDPRLCGSEILREDRPRAAVAGSPVSAAESDRLTGQGAVSGGSTGGGQRHWRSGVWSI